jgi:O-antigen/teichoic acid export membrane protein
MSWRRVIGNLAWVTMLRIGMAAMGFAQFWLLSHRLDAKGLGGFSLLMGLFVMLQSLPLLGLNTPLVRRVAAEPSALGVEITNSLAFGLPIAALLAMGLSGYGAWARPDLLVPFTLLGLCMLPTAWTLVAECGLMGLEALQGVAMINLAEATWRALGAWWSMESGWGLAGVMGTILVGRLATALAYACHPRLPAPRWRNVSSTVQARYRQEMPTYLGLSVIAALSSRLDTVLLSHLKGLSELGIYASAARLYEASLMLSTIANIVVFPRLSQLYATNPQAFRHLLDRCLRWTMLAGLPMVLCGMAVAPVLIRVVYIPSLWGAAPVLQCLFIATWLMALDQLLSSTMIATQSQRHDLSAMVLGTLATVVLIALFSHGFGLTGAAAGLTTALALRVWRRLRWADQSLPLPGLQAYALRALLAALGAIALFCWAQGDAATAIAGGGHLHPLPTGWQSTDVLRLALAGLVGVSAHAGLALLLNAWSEGHRDDWRRLQSALLTRKQA